MEYKNQSFNNDETELLKFFVKKYHDLNYNIDLEELELLMNQKFQNLNMNQRFSILYYELKNHLTSDEKEKIFEYFCMKDNNIKTKEDFISFVQNTRLSVLDLKSQIEKRKEKGKLIKIDANSELGFNYPFMLYIPNNLEITEVNNLLLHSCNTPEGILDYKNVNEFTMIYQLLDNSIQFTMADGGKIPLIMPIIPRFKGYNPEYIEDGLQKSNLETFIKIQSELDPKYQMTKEQIILEFNKSKNILSQQMNMCDYAISYLRKIGILMSDRIKVEGHSAGSKNATSLINKYPNRIVKNNGFFIGGTTGRATVYDKTISGVIYNGELDKNNPADFYIDDKGIPRAVYKEIYSDEYALDEQIKFKQALEEWKKENPNRDTKEFNIVQYDIRKQHEIESKINGRKSLLVEKYGHNACDSEIVRNEALIFAKEREEKETNNVSNSNTELNHGQIKNKNNREKKKLYLDKKRYLAIKKQENLQKDKNSNINLPSMGIINILFLSILTIIFVTVIFSVIISLIIN